MLMADPSSRFTEDELRETTEYAKSIGFGIEEAPVVSKSRGALLRKKGGVLKEEKFDVLHETKRITGSRV